MATVPASEYDAFAADYHWLYSDRVLSGGPFLEGNADVLRSLPPQARILDCACGIGVHSLALARRGYDVRGTDASAGMVAKARRRAALERLDVEFTTCPWADLPKTFDRHFDMVLDEGEPPIVFTLGSSAVWDASSFHMESIAAAQQLGGRAVLLVGNDPLNHPPEPLPKNVIAVAYAPFTQIFPRASVIVHHGSIGTTGQGLRAGKPMLVMPFGGDQYDNGARIERLGVGSTIMRKQYTAERAAVELKRLFDNSSYRERAADSGRLVQAEKGVCVACDAIEGQLS